MRKDEHNVQSDAAHSITAQICGATVIMNFAQKHNLHAVHEAKDILASHYGQTRAPQDDGTLKTESDAIMAIYT